MQKNIQTTDKIIDQECWNEFVNAHKTGCFYNRGGKSLNFHWTEFICIFIEKNYFVLLSVIYLQCCKIVQRQWKTQSPHRVEWPGRVCFKQFICSV